MKKVIIYGGAFNPPTKAHHAILQALVDEAYKNDSEVWLVPSGERLDKTIGISIDARIVLCKALMNGIRNNKVVLKLMTFELLAETNTNTIESARYLENKYPNHTFTWVFGSDSIETMSTWPGGKRLFSTLKMLVIARPYSQLDRLPPRAKLLKTKAITTSSTEVRNRLKNGDTISHLTPKNVAILLESLSLY